MEESMTNETKQALAWTALPFAAVANGVLRDFTYGRRMGETASHSLAVAPLSGVVRLWAGLLARRWPLRSRRAAMGVGVVWLVLTLGFEFGLGKARGASLEEILSDYDVRRGRLWPLALCVVAAAPLLAYRRRETG
jgi:hypothetical protein